MKESPTHLPEDPGHEGMTQLPGGLRVFKSDVTICALGALDELNASLGVLRSRLADADRNGMIERIQHDLLAVGEEVAMARTCLDAGRVSEIEADTRRMEEGLPPATGFILPGKRESAAFANWARTVCRRAERELVQARESQPERILPHALHYLNRLSSLLFAMARRLDLDA